MNNRKTSNSIEIGGQNQTVHRKRNTDGLQTYKKTHTLFIIKELQIKQGDSISHPLEW